MAKTAQEFIEYKKAKFEKELDDPKAIIVMKDINRKGKHIFKRKAWTLMVQHNLCEKVFILERLEKIDQIEPITHKELKIGDIEYRIGYFMLGKIGRMNGRWTWGQYCPMIPQKDFSKLLEKAKQDKTII